METIRQGTTEIHAQIFAKFCFCCNTKRDILYGPAALGDMEFWHLYLEQGLGQTLLFLQHWCTPGQPSSLLKIAVAWNQYSLGTGTSFLQDIKSDLSHNKSKWLASLCKFLGSIDASLQLDKDGMLPLQKENDCLLMDSMLVGPNGQSHQIIKCENKNLRQKELNRAQT